MHNRLHGVQGKSIVLILVMLGLALLFTALFIGGNMLGINLLGFVLPAIVSISPQAGPTAAMYGAYLGCWFLLLVALFLIRPIRPILMTVGPKLKGNRVSFSLLGLAIGLGLNSLCVAAAALHGDIQLQWGRFDLLPMLLVFVTVWIQSSSEEFLCRGIFFQLTARVTKNPWALFLANSLLFSLMHIMNQGLTPLAIASLILFGVLMTAVMYCTDSLWAAFMLHTGWNFSQNILWGLPNSGILSRYHMMDLSQDTARNSLFYDVVFGVENSWFVVLLLAVASLLLILWGRKHKRRPTFVWEESR